MTDIIHDIQKCTDWSLRWLPMDYVVPIKSSAAPADCSSPRPLPIRDNEETR